MKVRCTRLLDAPGRPQERSPWLTIGKTYHVLSVEYGNDRKWLLRLMGDGLNGVALFPLEEFDILTSKMPQTWTISWADNGFFSLMPEPWNRNGFWERYYDKEPDAVRVFAEEKTKIIESES